MSENIVLGPQDVMKDPGENVVFATYTLNMSADKHEKVKEVIADLADHITPFLNSMRIRYPDGDLRFVFGMGSNAWDYLYPKSAKPKELAPFKEIDGPKEDAIATPGDLFFHIRAKEMTICYQIHQLCYDIIADYVELVDETHGFRYFEGRSIIGFVDGTENPSGTTIPSYALIGDEDKDFINGSYAFTQKYIHDMSFWNNLSTENQEKSVGRKKFDDLELPDAEKMKNAHNIVSKDVHDGKEHKIIRMNVPYAVTGQKKVGTYFIGYSRYFSVINNMLTNMFEGKPKGNYDRLLDFSKPLTGVSFFIPSYDTLAKIADGSL